MLGVPADRIGSRDEAGKYERNHTMTAHDELLTEAKNELARQEEALARYRNVRQRFPNEENHALGAMDDVIAGTEASITTIQDYIALISEE